MQPILITAISFHVLAAVTWAGSTFVLGGMPGSNGERLFGAQMSAAAIAIVSGGFLWRTLHQGVFDTMEKVLGIGVVCALLALAVQLAVVGRARRNLRKQTSDADAQRSRIVVAHRIAAVLLAVTTLSMAAARYA